MNPSPPTEPAHLCPSCGAPLGESGICPPCLFRGVLAEPVVSRDGGGDQPPPSDFGDYRIAEALGEGAMGVVYRARKLSLKKDVAIKFLKAGAAASARQRAMFQREAELSSQLEHPNIASVTEVGQQDGRLYLVMRFIDGRPLSERLIDPTFRPTVAERVNLLLEVARAVHHAHQRGVIHRDLKPGNILIGPEDTPFVSDFGLARWLEKESTITHADGFAIGTPAFMAPEQASGQSRDLTTVSDVWSLGVILYLLVSGRLPFEAASLPGLVHCILRHEPVSPFRQAPTPHGDAGSHDGSTQLPAAADSARLLPARRRDLESICSRCLEKEPARRYPSAGALAEDLERWLDGRPVEARRANSLERAHRWIRRYPARAGIVMACSVAVAALAWSWWQRTVNRRTRDLQQLYHYVADRNLAGYGLADSNSVVFRRAMEAASMSLAGPGIRGIEAGLLLRLGESAFAPVWYEAKEPLLGVSVDPLRSNVAVLGQRHLHWIAPDARPLRRWEFPAAMQPTSMLLGASGKEVLVASDRGIDRFVPDQAEPVAWYRGKTHAMALGPSGQLAAIVETPASPATARIVIFPPFEGGAAGDDPSARGAAGEPWNLPPFSLGAPGTPVGLGWSESGVLRHATVAGGISEWSPPSGTGSWQSRERVSPGLRSPAGVFSHRADRYFRSSIYGLGHVFAIPGGATLLEVTDLPGNDAAMAFSLDDRWVATAAVDGSVRVREIGATGDSAPSLTRVLMPGHVEAISAIAFAPDPTVVYTCSADGTVRRLVVGEPSPTPYLSVRHRLKTMAGAAPNFAPSRSWVALHEARFFGRNPSNDVTMICDIGTGDIRGRVPGAVIGWGPGDRALACDRDGGLNVWELVDPANPRHVTGFRLNPNHHGKIESKLAEADRWIVSVTDSSGLEAFEVASSSTRHLGEARISRKDPSIAPLPGQTLPAVEAVATSPGSAFAAVYLADHGTWLWDIRRNELHPLLPEVPADMRFSPDGARLAVTDYHRRLRLFDGRTGVPAESLPGHLGTVSAVAFTPDGRQLVTGGDDYTLVVWNLATQREVFRSNLRTRTFWITVSPDGRWLATAHPPRSMNDRRTDVGEGEYRLWPLFGAHDPEPPRTLHRAHPDSVWNHLDTLAAKFGENDRSAP